MQTTCHYQSPLSDILLVSDEQGLCGLWFEEGRYYADTVEDDAQVGTSPALDQARRWLDKYFAGQAPPWLPPLHVQGTPFQRQVWDQLLTIPYGHLVTYGELAKRVAKLRHRTSMSAQAVGNAVGKNHLSLFIPCHRVIGAHGNLTGYGGGLARKVALLELEGHLASDFSWPS